MYSSIKTIKVEKITHHEDDDDFKWFGFTLLDVWLLKIFTSC